MGDSLFIPLCVVLMPFGQIKFTDMSFAFTSSLTTHNQSQGTFVRLAWHCSGSFSKEDGSGGSNGARMRFNPEASWGANAGLGVARDALEPIKEKHPEISYADLYTLAGVVAVEESGGPTIPYRLGREDFDSGETSPPDGRLPDADKGSKKMTTQHVREVFYRMGFNDREIVALLGAHALGRCHTDRSGYWVSIQVSLH